jgi:hypothetical protein
LKETIHNYYRQTYEPTTLTCYVHLQCNRGSALTCLDWTEICDRIVDCQDGIDEISCWLLELNECEENEYRCENGQCIEEMFLRNDYNTFECLDRSDVLRSNEIGYIDIIGEPTFAKEDISCFWRDLSSEFRVKFTISCLLKRDTLLEHLVFVQQPNSISDDCWLAVKCQLAIPDPWEPICDDIRFDKQCTEVINETCP